MIDTEAGRACHYADAFRFDHGALNAPFRPEAYTEAIVAADKAGYPVIVVDSMSHEHAGAGGLLEYHEDELDRMAGQDWKKREACKMSAWITPKTEHKKMVSRLLQIKAHLILCFRAEEKIEMKRVDGKTQIIKKETATGLDGWVPVCEKNLPYELTVSFLLLASKPGVPMPIKLQEQHKPLFPVGEIIDESCGERLAKWASGSGTTPIVAPVASADSSTTPSADQITYDLQKEAHREALRGLESFKNFWDRLTNDQKRILADLKDEFKALAQEVDKNGPPSE